jgi:hypothetical protein
VCVLLLKGSQLYNYPNTVVDTFVPGMDSGMKWLEVLEPDKMSGILQMVAIKWNYLSVPIT